MTFDICFLNPRNELACLLVAEFSSEKHAARYAELVMASRFCPFPRAEIHNAAIGEEAGLSLPAAESAAPQMRACAFSLHAATVFPRALAGSGERPDADGGA